jgi:hypothetical protein
LPLSLNKRFLFFRNDQDTPVESKAAISFLSSSAFTMGADLLTKYEGSNMGEYTKSVESQTHRVCSLYLLESTPLVTFSGMHVNETKCWLCHAYQV